MIGHRAFLARCLAGGRLLLPAGRVRAACRQHLPVLAYHRVLDVARDDDYPFDLELISASIDSFAWQMDYVRRNFDPITFRHLVRAIDGEEKLPKRPVIITFDDGFDDNYHSAFPILSAHGIPATIFLATGYLDGPRTYWFDRLVQLLLAMPAGPLVVPASSEPLWLPHDRAGRRLTARRVLEVLKRIPNELRLEWLRRIEQEHGTCADPEDLRSRPMTWNHVREMALDNIEFGSHSVTHPILRQVSDPDLRVELVESRRAIERELGRTCDVISYPVGREVGFDDRVQHAARGAGYRLGVSYLSGSNRLPIETHFALRRLHIERDTDRAWFAAMLQLPDLFH